MTKSKAETTLSKQIADQLDQLGIWHLRLNSGRVKVRGGWMHLCPEGTPDRVCLLEGRAVFIEVKVPGEQPTPEQIACHERIKQNGGIVLVIETAAQVWESLRNLLNVKH